MLTFTNEEIKWVSLPISSKRTPFGSAYAISHANHAQEEKRRLEQIRTPPFTPYYHAGPIQSPESEYRKVSPSESKRVLYRDWLDGGHAR